MNGTDYDSTGTPKHESQDPERPSIFVDRPVAHGGVDQYAPGNKWHVDEFARLHIIGPSGNIATYQPEAWTCVYYERAK